MEVEIRISIDLLEKVKTLAKRLYGNSGPEAINQTISEALSMRMHWAEISSDVAREVDEPVAHFEMAESGEPARNELVEMLFREKG